MPGYPLWQLVFILYTNVLAKIDSDTPFIIYSDGATKFYPDPRENGLAYEPNDVPSMLPPWPSRNSEIKCNKNESYSF